MIQVTCLIEMNLMSRSAFGACIRCDGDSMSHHGAIHRSIIATCAGSAGEISPWHLLSNLDSLLSPGLFSHPDTWPSNQPLASGLVTSVANLGLGKSWLKAEHFRGRGDPGVMNFLQCGQSDQESRPEPEPEREMLRGGGKLRYQQELSCCGETHGAIQSPWMQSA